MMIGHMTICYYSIIRNKKKNPCNLLLLWNILKHYISTIVHIIICFFSVRWDVNYVERLPEYMKMCFLVLYNEINQMGYDVLRDKELNVIPYLKQVVSFFVYKSLIKA